MANSQDGALRIRSVALTGRAVLPYAEQGDAAGVPLVLLHGYADSWRSFELVLPFLPDSVHAIAVTQRGHADASRPPGGYRPRDHAADVAALLDALHLKAAVIVGGSSGGFAARRFAVDYPQRTLGLVLLGCPFSLADKPLVRELWETTISGLTDPVDRRFVQSFQESTYLQPVAEDFLRTMVSESLKLPAFVWRDTLAGFLEDDTSRSLGRITAPTLLLWGEQDTIVSRSDQERWLAAIAGSRIKVYPDVGHAIYWEAPGRVASDIEAFVTEQVVKNGR